MTPAETLAAAVRADDEATIAQVLAGMSEDDRAALIPTARVLADEERKRGAMDAGNVKATVLVAYGVLPVSDIRRLGWRAGHLSSRVVDVLRGRSPERLGPIVDYLLDDVGGGRAWSTVRPLVREGIVPRPDRPSYILAMLDGTRYESPAAVMADDPGLLEVEAWRLFEVEGGGDTSLANHEKFFGDVWGTTFRELAATDAGMRQRLLDASLAALARDFAQYRAGWFSRFHESLEPTDDERTRRVDAYAGLLRSRVGPTVSMAVAALARVDRAGGLSPDLLLDRIGPVLTDAPAGTAKAALGLVSRAGAGSPDRPRRAAIVATEALVNRSPDVQGAAIALIGRLVDGPDDTVAAAVAARLPEVAASQRPAATALAAKLGNRVAAATASSVTEPACVVVTERPSPLDPARAITPLGSIEDLVDVAVSVVESGEPADDLERVLDGVGRLGAVRPDGFVRLTAPLARRARTILARRESFPFGGYDPRADAAAVLLAWSTGEAVETRPIHSSVAPGAGAFLSARARQIAEAVAAGRSFVSVAAPTHAGGWIDPVVLVQRLGAGPPASNLDLVAAILRLAPVGREAALVVAAGLPDEPGNVVRYALGGDERIGPTAAWWVAAARVRGPGEDDPGVERRHPRLGPDAGRAARIRYMVGDERRLYGGLGIEVEPPAAETTDVALPTVQLLYDPSSFFWNGRSDPAMFRWMATIQPGYRESWAAVGGLLIARNVDWWSAEWANRAFLEPFLDPATPIGPHARTLLGFALGAKEAGERGLATDVVQLALADGRLTAADLADGLATTVALDRDRPNRWALALAEAALSPDGLAAAVADAIARTLPALAERPAAKLVPLLRLLDELLAGTGTSPAEEGRGTLTTLAEAGGQAGRLARSILGRGQAGSPEVTSARGSRSSSPRSPRP